MLTFSKYQGTGNDFIMVDNRSGVYDGLTIVQIQHLCDRKFGIGADGLIKLNSHPIYDFEVDYYNADGSKSFCGNGARCSVMFAHDLGLDVSETTFMAIDGVHQAWKKDDLIELEMLPVFKVFRDGEALVLNTGSPHYVVFSDDLDSLDVYEEGKAIRYNERYQNGGINVNFIQEESDTEFEIRTYERGVENETLSCGTGLTAAAMVMAIENELFGYQALTANTKGGTCYVGFNRTGEMKFEEVRLIGPAKFIFKGEVNEHI
jgi:diaminopimelate epimerase